MMNWLAAWLLHPAMAFGAAAVASPILIHLLSRRRFRRVLWPAMDFLLEAHRQNRRRARIEQLILLALRCLAVLLLVLVLARPFVRPGLVAALLGAAVRTERIVLLDDSFSMAYGDGEQRVFDRARQAVERLIR
ncbi:MAG: BatA domain-containing protein, partial [Phycisphaerae bacterium]